MSAPRTVTQIDAAARCLLPGSLRGFVERRGQEVWDVHDEPAREEWAIARPSRRPPISGLLSPDAGREGGPHPRKKGNNWR